MFNVFFFFQVLSRVKVRFLDTIIRLEHVPLDSMTGVAMEVSIKNLEYSDEAGSDPNNVPLDANQSNKGYVVSAFSTKRFYLEGVTFHTDEFPSRARTFSRSVMTMSRASTPDSRVNNIPQLQFLLYGFEEKWSYEYFTDFLIVFFSYSTEFRWKFSICTNIATSTYVNTTRKKFH